MFFSPGMDTEIWFLPWLSTVAPLVPALTRSLRMVTMVLELSLADRPVGLVHHGQAAVEVEAELG